MLLLPVLAMLDRIAGGRWSDRLLRLLPDDRGEAGEGDGGDGDGSDDAGDDDTGSGDDSGGDDGDDDKPLGPKGEKAYLAEKEKRRAAQAELREWKALGLTPAQIKEIVDARKDDDKPDPERVKREAETTAQQKANARILRSEIKAAAAGKLADPADAYKFLDLTKFEVDDDGNVDEEEIADAIDELIKKKPYLSAQGGKRFGGDSDGGRKGDRKKSQLTREDLKGMSPAEILTAQKDGRLADLLKG
jgi:DNA-binding transcriptional MerR regulator